MYPSACSQRDSDYARSIARTYLKRAEVTVSYEQPLVRQWMLLRALCARRYGATVKELCGEMGVSDKTIRRDLETFRRAGFPLEETVCEFGKKKWRIDPAKTQPGLTFAFDEAIALYLGRHFLEPLAGTYFWHAAQCAFKKIRASLGDEALRHIERFGRMFHKTVVGASDYSKKADLIDLLMQGIEERRAVFITYQSLSATEPVTYDIYPYGIAYHRGSLYLVGWSPDHKEIRHWKVDRIEELHLEEFRFPWPEDFSLPAHLAKSFGVFRGDGEVNVKVRFAPRVARYVQESKWHESQQLVPQKDGSLLATFDLNHTEEIKRWILSFGQHAEVLEPESLRAELGEELGQMGRLYGERQRAQSKEPPRKG
jgi:predicted DNA-binding transcriptional regulator YafY